MFEDPLYLYIPIDMKKNLKPNVNYVLLAISTLFPACNQNLCSSKLNNLKDSMLLTCKSLLFASIIVKMRGTIPADKCLSV